MISVLGTRENVHAAVYRMGQYDTLGLKVPGNGSAPRQLDLQFLHFPASLDTVKPLGGTPTPCRHNLYRIAFVDNGSFIVKHCYRIPRVLLETIHVSP